MPDMRLNTALTITNDLKTRPVADPAAVDMSNSQFMDMMMSRLSALSHEDDELKTLLSKVNQKGGTDRADNDALLNHLQKMRDTSAADKAEPVAKKAEVKEKIKTRIKEIAARDTTPVKDTKAMKALQKVAKFLVEANDKGEISLPPAMVQKLQEFLAKGDDLKAFDMASFMTEFTDVFKNVTVALPAAGAVDAGTLQWPDDIKAVFNDLGLQSMAGSADKPLDMLSVLRAVKSLVNQSEKAALQTLSDKASAAVATQVDNSVLVANAPVAADTFVRPDKTETNPQVAATSVPAAPVMKKEETSFVQPTKGNVDAKDESLVKEGKQSDKPLAAEVAKATVQASQTQTNYALAVDVKNAFTAATPVAGSDAGVQMVKADGIAPASLAAKAATANSEIVREAVTAKPSAATQQVMAQIQTRGNKSTQISVQLTPAELGRVEVRLSIGKDGQAHAVVMADRLETLALLQKDSTHLERSLQQAGINANAGNMSFNLRDQNQAQQFGQGRKRFTRDDVGGVKTQEMSLSALNDAAVFSDTRINYHA